jgi:hypothetical protein
LRSGRRIVQSVHTRNFSGTEKQRVQVHTSEDSLHVGGEGNPFASPP